MESIVSPTLPIPNGWFAVAASEEVAKGEVVIRHYFGQDLVVFRTESGAVSVFDPYCPHLGAHLGHGGRVEGERLRCPFHGWAFDVLGTCREIAYAKRIPENARAKRWPTLERFGFVFVWRDAIGAAPWFELATMTPVDAKTSHVRYAFTQPRVNGQDPKGGVAAAITATS